MYDPKPKFSHSYSNNDRFLAQNNQTSTNLCNDQQVVQFRPNNHHPEEETDDSGVCSPPLWKNSPSPSEPLLSHHTYSHRSLSPNTRALAIAQGQKELMEMVRNMPESSYELSLKDLVENHMIETQTHHVERSNDSNLKQRGSVKVKRQESKKIDNKNLGFENKGMFLHMVFPFNMGSKKKKKNSESNFSAKVSPKTSGGEKDWWKKKSTGSSDSDSSRTSINSGSSVSTESSSGGSIAGSDRRNGGRRKRNGFLTGCWTFFKSRRSKSEE